MTRYEFAAGLNACLDVVTQLISGDGEDSLPDPPLVLSVTIKSKTLVKSVCLFLVLVILNKP